MTASTTTPDVLRLESASGRLRYMLQGKPLCGGEPVALCFSGGWVVGRFEWSTDPADSPRFHCSIELQGGRVEALEFPIPHRALLRRPQP